MSPEPVSAWSEKVKIPTYRIGLPDKNPMFLEKRVYQGSSGAIYPHPVIDRVFDEKEDQEYTALFLENRYLKVMVLPELGGRVQMALDKTNGYHFVYYNRVIKPALVGLSGPWISGGIEFNWPQHHRPSTFDALDWLIQEGPEGSRTVWCSEMERMFNTKGMHGFTLYPDRAYLEVRVQLYNRTPLPQTFLWWANPAVHVNDDYQSVFPPDVHAVMDHGKRDVSTFPIATGTYYKVNYAPGTDISRYKNIPVPTSYMAYHSDYDFLGCYDHGKQAGMMHVADHHVVPGKKQWTWGNGDFGRAWDRQLTDEDGPYIELMCGAYTDNQPDFSWIMPGEEKRFTQVFMPYKRIGAARNASKEAVLNLQVEGERASFGVYVTWPRRVRVRLLHKASVLFERELELSPETALLESAAVPPGALPPDLTLQVLDGVRELLRYSPLPESKAEIPSPASPALPPREIKTAEELFMNGLHLEQYRHATYAPEAYYQEALHRDPLDSRCNNALGLLLLRRGRFAEAEAHFRKAVQRWTQRNPNPYDGEPYYNLGLALKFQARFAEAQDAFYKSIWNSAWQDAAYFELARLACRSADFEEALDLAERSLERNARHAKARHLKTALLRRLGRAVDALVEARQALAFDPLDFGALWELCLLQGSADFERLARGDSNTYIEISLDYAQAGLFAEAVELIGRAPLEPMVKYYQGWYHWQAGEEGKAFQAFQAALAPLALASRASVPPDFCFPNKLESVTALQVAMRLDPADARAPYYLGNFWYAHRRHREAVDCWELARGLDPAFPTTHRNLGLAYFNQFNDAALALESYEQAFALDPSDARVFYELDQLCKRLNRPLEERLARMEAYSGLVEQRDDLATEQVTLLNLLGRPEAAYHSILRRNFHPWEGGEGKITAQYVLGLVEMARLYLQGGEPARAVEALQQAQVYPSNLGEGKLAGAQENPIFYYLGLAHRALGEADPARACLERASRGLSEPTSAVFYNDQPPESIFYQGLALQALGQAEEARQRFGRMVEYGRSHIDDPVKIDYFAVSLPDFLVFEEDLQRRNRVHCHTMQALGHMGLGESQQALDHFDQALELDASHVPAVVHRRLLTSAHSL